jgi:two-component system, cell cycle sensor histidine kinase and response regulator CckA
MPTTHEPASILIVDDDPGTLQSIGDVLERRGHAVRTATQARAALELLTDRSVDAAILDLHLPDVSGLVLLQAIKTSAPATEVIIITDQASATTAIEAINSGAFGYVTKPFKMDHLMATIDKALAKQRAERALWERTRSLETLIDAAAVAIVALDAAGRVTTWSRAAERMFGWKEHEVLGHSVPTIPDARRAEFDQAAARNLQGEATLYESHRRRKDGTLIDVLSSTAPIIDAEGLVSGTLAVIIDITERKQLEEQLRQAMKMEGIARLAGGISHDFNNLMTVISVRCHLVLGQLPADHPNRRDIKIIGDAGDRAASLTRQLLAFSRSQILDATVLDIDDVISDMKALLEPVLREDVDLIMDLDPSTGQVTADRGQLEQIILILAINARDAMPEGGQFTIGTRNVELDDAYVRRHVDARPGPHVVLTVSDSGTGMDAATRARIFEPFFTTKDIGKGRGLGLAAAYGIIHQSHGHITVDSEPGQGTTFRIYLPRPEAGATVEAAIEPSGLPRGTETVLLVEDEPSFRALARELLEMLGYTVLESEDVSHALRIAEGHAGTIHLLITDVVMPRMNGRTLAKAVQGFRPDIKVLYMSGYTDNVIIHEGILDPGTPFLQKSFTPSKLARKVREVLDPPH